MIKAGLGLSVALVRLALTSRSSVGGQITSCSSSTDTFGKLSLLLCFSKMHLGLIDLVRGVFSPTTAFSKALSNGDVKHEYVRGNIQQRSPCPGLNALANHGYL